MHAVINKLTLGRPFDEALVRKIGDDLGPRMKAHAGFVDLQVVHVSDTEAVVVVSFATREALDDVSKNVAGPWFAEHVRPYLAGPVQRSVGEVVASVGRAPAASEP